MKSNLLIIFTLIALVLSSVNSYAFWVWNPKTKKIVNPKYAVKDTPEEQFNWAMQFFKRKNYERSGPEFLRLVRHYNTSELAPEAQYYAGRSYDEWGKYHRAFLEYQKVVDDYPYSKRIDEIVKREFRIGNKFYSKQGSKLAGMELMDSLDKALEVYNQVIENAPYGKYADKSQFKIGQCYKRLQQYNEAIAAFQKLEDEHPKSGLVKRATYEVANCTYLASLKADYDQEPTDEAIEEYKKYALYGQSDELKAEAERVISQLKEKKAESAFNTAAFYERGKHYKSAIMYYREIIDKYPNTTHAEVAREKIKLLEEKVAN
jgi:outer membrane assembly lipoprotein YfiO